jgi:hypothetical protein
MKPENPNSTFSCGPGVVMNAKELLARIQLHKEQTAAIQTLWASLFPEFPEPDARQCQVWLTFYTFDHIVKGLDTVLTRCATREHIESQNGPTAMTRDDIFAYATGVMKKLKKDEEQV